MTTPKPRVLALDLGAHFGWAATESVVGCSWIGYGHKRLSGDKESMFFYWLRETLEHQYSPSVVVYEDIKRHLSTAAAHAFGGYRAIMNLNCQMYGIESVGVGVGEWKKHITGKGNAPKNDVIAAIQKRGYNVTDDNEADAIGILLYALETGVVEAGE